MNALDLLRETRHALTPERTVAALGRALDAWRAPDSPWVERLAREHRLYAPEVIREAVPLALAEWTAERMAALREREMAGGLRPPELTAVWLAGSIPTAAFSALLLPLLTGSAVYAKTASADRVSPRLFAESLRAADLEVGACLAVGEDATVLDVAEVVVAHGSDATIAALRERVAAPRIFVGHGHKVSLACVGPHADLDAAAEALARDVAYWDGRGCLSPGWALVIDPDGTRAPDFARALARALERAQRRLPRGRLVDAEEMALHDLRARAASRPGTHLEMSKDGTAWTVLLEPPGSRPDPGTLRALPLLGVADLDALDEWCRGVSPHLSSIAHVGMEGALDRLLQIACDAGASRTCPLGELQLPPLEWPHDGLEPIRPLLRDAQGEPA